MTHVILLRSSPPPEGQGFFSEVQRNERITVAHDDQGQPRIFHDVQDALEVIAKEFGSDTAIPVRAPILETEGGRTVAYWG